MKIFAPNGYLDMEKIISSPYHFIMVLTGRGTGKTFGALDYLRKRAIKGDRFMYFRRLQTQIDIVAKPEFSPFKKLDAVRHTVTDVKSLSKQTAGFYDDSTGDLLGYAAAVSTFANLRGFDGSDIGTILFEECIPKLYESKIRDEGAALMDAYETINRNRELEGDEPVKLVCIGNSNNSGADLLCYLNLVSRVEKMKKNGTMVYTDPARSLLLIVLKDSPMGEKKADTALYRFLGRESDYAKAALDNEPPEEWGEFTGKLPLKELTPVVSVGEITVYRHKSRHTLYVSTHKQGSPPTYGTGQNDMKRVKTLYRWIWQAYITQQVIFEETVCEILFTKYFS